MKYLVAVVEDSPVEVKTLRSYFARLGEELGYDFQVSCFSSGRDFLAAYQPIYNLVLMDINLPDINGMYVSKCLRKLDQNVVLMFVTSMARYAADGYEVDALDFMVKPVNYTTFSLKIKRGIQKSAASQDRELLINISEGLYRTSAARIKYVEVTNHSLAYHTTDGVLNSYGNLKDVEARLDSAQFIRCNRCYLVNLAFVRAVEGSTLVVDRDKLQISRPKRAAVLEALNNYLGGGV